MQTLFTEVFTARMPAEQLETCCETIDLFETVGFTAPFEALQQCIELNTTHVDNDGYVGQAKAILDDGLDLLLKAFGVEVIASTTTEFKKQTATTLTQLEDYYLPQELLDVLDAEADPVNVIAEILYITQGISVEETLDNLHSVEPKLIDKLRVVLLQRMEYSLVESIITEPEEVGSSRGLRIQVLNRLIHTTDREDFTIVPELIQSGVRIGTLDPVTLVNQHIETLTLIDPIRLAKELFSVVVFSYTTKESWFTTTRELALEFTDLLTDIRKVDRYLDTQKGLLPNA